MEELIKHYYPHVEVQTFLENSMRILKTEEKMIGIYEAIFFNSNNLGSERREIPELNLRDDIVFFDTFATFPKEKNKFKQDILRLISLPNQNDLYSKLTRQRFESLMDLDDVLLRKESKLNIQSAEELYLATKDYVFSYLIGRSK